MTRRQCHDCLKYFDPEEGYEILCKGCYDPDIVETEEADDLYNAKQKYEELLLVWDADPSHENSEKLDRAQDNYDRLRLGKVNA